MDGVVVTAVNEIPNWHAPEYGDSEADDVLEAVMRSIRWSAAPETPKVAVNRLVVGASYKLQLLFAEQCCAGRGFNVVVNGAWTYCSARGIGINNLGRSCSIRMNEGGFGRGVGALPGELPHVPLRARRHALRGPRSDEGRVPPAARQPRAGAD